MRSRICLTRRMVCGRALRLSERGVVAMQIVGDIWGIARRIS